MKNYGGIGESQKMSNGLDGKGGDLMLKRFVFMIWSWKMLFLFIHDYELLSDCAMFIFFLAYENI